MGGSSASVAEPAYAGSRSLGRGIVFLAGVATDPAGGPDHSVSGMDVLSCGPVPLGFSDSDDPDPEPDH